MDRGNFFSSPQNRENFFSEANMSQLPFMYQEMFGVRPAPQEPRTSILSDDLDAEFEANWAFAGSGTADPVPQQGVATLLGPTTRYWPRFGRRSDAPAGFGCEQALHCAVNKLRQNGFVIELESEAAKKLRVTQTLESISDPEERDWRERMELSEVSDCEVHDSGGSSVAKLKTCESQHGPWLMAQCATPTVTESVAAALKSDFHLSELRYESKELPFFRKPGYKVVVVTGSARGPECSASKFTVTKGDKVVAKALLSYRNEEMESAGPTLETIEVAKKWRQHGLGSLLMNTIRRFLLTDVFNGPAVRKSIEFSASYVTNKHASEWLQKHHNFHDIGMMGEELSKRMCK
eukprot:m.87668 g.87668  ORF g.87668 m.87668 type:complete len:349 (-) comp26105_c0_seq2:13-1059(-)